MGWMIYSCIWSSSKKCSSSPIHPKWLGGPSSLLFKGWQEFFSWRYCCHDMNSVPSNAYVKRKWSCTFTHPICFHDTNRDNATFIFYIRCYQMKLKKIISCPSNLMVFQKSEVKLTCLPIRMSTQGLFNNMQPHTTEQCPNNVYTLWMLTTHKEVQAQGESFTVMY